MILLRTEKSNYHAIFDILTSGSKVKACEDNGKIADDSRN